MKLIAAPSQSRYDCAGKRVSVPIEVIENRIFLIRGEKVIIDADLARFFGVTTKRLNEQVKRNSARFPEDFIFQLSTEEKDKVVASCDHLGKLKYSNVLPHAFTEHGAIMASNVLNSTRAIEMGLFVVRAFVNHRRTIGNYQELERKICHLENRMVKHDKQLVSVVHAIRSLISPGGIPKKRRIGFDID